MKRDRIKALAPKSTGDTNSRVYLIGLKSGVVKVGQSYHVRNRIRCHMKTHGDQFAWSHVFAGYGAKAGRGIEQDAISQLSEIGQRQGRTEQFSGITKQQAIACVRTCIAERADRDAKWATQRIAYVTDQALGEAFRACRPFCWVDQKHSYLPSDTDTKAAA